MNTGARSRDVSRETYNCFVAAVRTSNIYSKIRKGLASIQDRRRNNKRRTESGKLPFDSSVTFHRGSTDPAKKRRKTNGSDQRSQEQTRRTNQIDATVRRIESLVVFLAMPVCRFRLTCRSIREFSNFPFVHGLTSRGEKRRKLESQPIGRLLAKRK